MHLSDLQQYVLTEVYFAHQKKVSRKVFNSFYTKKSKVSAIQQVKGITKSIERLIVKGLMRGYGVRTPHKWFIKEVSLTQAGRGVVKKVIDKRQLLPFKRK